MKSENPAWHFILAFLIALIGYAVTYHFIEHRRTRKGPWQVTFTHGEGDTPTLVISQPKLPISNVQISFAGEHFPFTNATVVFDQPRPVPYRVPFGRCIFMDTTFLPGTITFNIFRHEIELLPRVLVIDRQEYPWVSGTNLALHGPAIAHQIIPK